MIHEQRTEFGPNRLDAEKSRERVRALRVMASAIIALVLVLVFATGPADDRPWLLAPLIICCAGAGGAESVARLIERLIQQIKSRPS